MVVISDSMLCARYTMYVGMILRNSPEQLYAWRCIRFIFIFLALYLTRFFWYITAFHSLSYLCRGRGQHTFMSGYLATLRYINLECLFDLTWEQVDFISNQERRQLAEPDFPKKKGTNIGGQGLFPPNHLIFWFLKFVRLNETFCPVHWIGRRQILRVSDLYFEFEAYVPLLRCLSVQCAQPYSVQDTFPPDPPMVASNSLPRSCVALFRVLWS